MRATGRVFAGLRKGCVAILRIQPIVSNGSLFQSGGFELRESGRRGIVPIVLYGPFSFSLLLFRLLGCNSLVRPVRRWSGGLV